MIELPKIIYLARDEGEEEFTWWRDSTNEKDTQYVRVDPKGEVIEENEYLEALSIVEKYKDQLAKLEEIRLEKLRTEKIQKENECAEHYYLPIIPRRWEASMRCQFCGKEIR